MILTELTCKWILAGELALGAFLESSITMKSFRGINQKANQGELVDVSQEMKEIHTNTLYFFRNLNTSTSYMGDDRIWLGEEKLQERGYCNV